MADTNRLAVPMGGAASAAFGALTNPGPINSALLDNNVINILFQQPELIPIIEHLIQQEQEQRHQQQISQRSFSGIGPFIA